MSHVSHEELSKRLADAKERIHVGDSYAHYKHPENTYRITGLAILEATDEVVVIYEWEYEPYFSFVRPVENFLETVTVNGLTIPRFKKV